MDETATSAHSESIKHMKIKRHRTAINRSGFSLPIRKALEGGLITKSTSILDYGCGKGEDIHRLHKIGIQAIGWDPVFRPDTELLPVDIVNLGYVINVIENPEERTFVLKRAWELAGTALLVSARTDLEKVTFQKKYQDGYLTEHNTFQKFFAQDELRTLISKIFDKTPIAVAPGVFYVFKSDISKLAYLAHTLRATTYSSKDIELDYCNVREELVPLLDNLRTFFVERGRLPKFEDIPEKWIEYSQHFGSVKRALGLIRKAEGWEWYEDIIQARKNDLLVLLARMIFTSRPRFSLLPDALQRDVRALFSSYRNACNEADELLFAAGEMNLISAACNFASVGKKTQSALYVHHTALSHLPPVLRVYEECARVVSGEIAGTNIIKLSKLKPQVSYLSYPDFDTDPHPELKESFLVRIPQLKLNVRDYHLSDNPPILHRKELLVVKDYPRRRVFSRLSHIEESHCLFNDAINISRKKEWLELLAKKGLILKGHRLLHCH